MALKTIQREDRRHQMLYLLSKEPDYSMNDSLMQKALEMIGHGVGPDLILADLAWLEDQDYISLSKVGSFTVAKINRRGISVAKGHSIVPGVSRTLPED